MEEEIISPKIAKIAKEKGFNKYVLNYYCIAEGSLDWDIMEDFEIPSQNLLQKWLREIHNIHIVIEPFKGEYGWRGLIGEKNKEPINISGFGGLEKTYEKALEEGLYQALKLIK